MEAFPMVPREEWRLDTHHLGRRVLVFDRVDSTNSRAAALAGDPGNDGLVLLADEQTAGRGQYGRSWMCSPGMGVLLSVMLFPPPVLRRPALLTAWAAVSVCETILRCTGLEARIKWPNDVLIHGRKVCGILIEQARGVVVGVGLNVNQTPEAFTEAGLAGAGSLAFFNHQPLDCGQVARLLLQEMDVGYGRLRGGDLSTLEAAWRQRLGLLGKEVLAECSDGVHAGRLREVTWDGIELVGPGSRTVRLRPEAVRHLEPA
jgi:BirA family biotin operon repressor/biotin-[acetyl-CoA-carboxylase] ligase